MADEVTERRDEAEALRVVEPVAAGAGALRARVQRVAAGPLAAAQQSFNGALLRLVDALSRRIDDAAARAAAAEQRVGELEERLLRLERRPAAAPTTLAPQPRAAVLPDYFAFESRMRGSTSEIRERQQPYVERLRGHAPVLDLGCGRGELLELLRDAGIEARGVDADSDMVAYAAGEGLDVAQADVHTALSELPDGSLGAVTALQVAEHLPPPELVELLRLARTKLRDGGLLVLETINPVSPAALRNYFADLTHAQPLVAETLALLVRDAGFREVETVFVNAPVVPADVVQPVAEHLFAALDYAIVATA
jgi:O-antigen chain-terminating methyltransferase